MGKERIGIMGGTLDPIHEGHLYTARRAMEAAELDRVLVMPSGNPPHKPHVTPGEHRWAMVCAACAGQGGLEPCSEELNRSGLIFTVDTLSILKEKYPRAELHYIIGADTLMELKNWREYGRILKLCRFLICPRESRWTQEETDAEQRRLTLLGGRFQWIQMDRLDVSSTGIREAIREGRPAEGLPVPVQEYAEAAGLYGADMRIPEAREWLPRLREALTPKRFAHTLGVAATARRLALRHGEDPLRAEAAGLLHDCAKCLPLKEMQRIAREHRLAENPADLETDALLHAIVGAHLARTEYGVTDPGVLSAIRRHTTGEPGMSRLDMAVWLADAIEPTRAPYPMLAELRALADESLERAILLSMESTLRHLRRKGWAISPVTARTADWLRTLPACRD